MGADGEHMKGVVRPFLKEFKLPNGVAIFATSFEIVGPPYRSNSRKAEKSAHRTASRSADVDFDNRSRRWRLIDLNICDQNVEIYILD